MSFKVTSWLTRMEQAVIAEVGLKGDNEGKCLTLPVYIFRFLEYPTTIRNGSKYSCIKLYIPCLLEQ